MPVFYTGYNWLFYCKSSGSLDCLPCRKTAVRVVYFTVSLSTLLTGKFICNCLYLNWLGNKSLAKKSFRKVVLADSCRGLSLAMRSISVTYCKSVPNRACQEGRKSWLSFIVFRKFICACQRHMSTQVSLRPVPVAGLCGPGVTCFPVGLPSGAGGQVYLSWLYPPYGHVCDDRLRFDPLDRSM